MRKLTPVMIAALAAVGLAPLSCGTPSELSRATALSLLRAAPDGTLRDAVWECPLSRTSYAVQGRTWSCAERKALLFFEALNGRRIVNLHQRQRPGDSWSPPATVYDIEVLDPTFFPNPALMRVVMGRARADKIEGIRQEGGTALVEALVSFEPTPLVAALLEAEEPFRRDPVGMNCASEADRKPVYELPAAKTQSFVFERYDDGWRLTRRHG